MNKRDIEERERIEAKVRYRTDWVVYRDKLNLNKPADLVAAQAKVFKENPELYKRYRAANTVRVGARANGLERFA